MEAILEKMESAELCGESTKSNFESLYKNWGKLGNQEERRREILEKQKTDRNTKLDAFRGILDLVNIVEEKDLFKSKKKVYYRPNIYVAGFHKASATYSNVLMMSEWMIEKPIDLAEEWYVTPCPKAGRVLVVAHANKTKCYTKYGQFKFVTNTALPGGNPFNSMNNRDVYCVLDCFYDNESQTIYVLDLLAWNNQPMTDCETEFRHYWLQSQFAENTELGVISKKNCLRFSLLPKVSCSPEELNKFMMNSPHFENNSPALDGLLFYHKRARYASGETPLVGWLYPYMVPEVLGEVTVHETYMKEKPQDYINQLDFIEKFEKKMKQKNKSRNNSKNNNSMDTSEVPHNDNEVNTENLAQMEPEPIQSQESERTAVSDPEISSTSVEEHEG